MAVRSRPTAEPSLRFPRAKHGEQQLVGLRRMPMVAPALVLPWRMVSSACGSWGTGLFNYAITLSAGAPTTVNLFLRDLIPGDRFPSLS